MQVTRDCFSIWRIALLSTGLLVPSIAQAQQLTHTCKFDKGPRAGLTLAYPTVQSIPVGAACQDGVASTGVAVPDNPNPQLTHTCKFDQGPRTGQTQVYPQSMPVGASCWDGVSSAGVTIADKTSAPEPANPPAQDSARVAPQKPPTQAPVQLQGGSPQSRAEGRDVKAEALSNRANAISQSQPPQVPTPPQTPLGPQYLQDQIARLSMIQDPAAAQKHLKEVEQTYGSEDLHTGDALDIVGDAFAQRQKYIDAEPYYKRALAIREKLLGPEHLQVAVSLNKLAGIYMNIYGAQGGWTETESLLTRALAIWDKHSPSKNRYQTILPEGVMDMLHTVSSPEGLENWNMRAVTYMSQGKYAEAEDLLKQVVAATEKSTGPENVGASTALLFLGNLYEFQGRLGEAETAYKKILSYWGPDDPSIADFLIPLGRIYQRLGRFAEAETHMKRALAFYERDSGSQDRNTSALLVDLGGLYYGWKKTAAAESYFGRGIQTLTTNLKNEFSTMSEIERIATFERTYESYALYFSFGINHQDQTEVVGQMYNVLMWEKGLVGRTMAADRARLTSSGDRESLQLFDKVIERKSELAAITLTLGPTERDEKSQQDILKLREEVKELERELARRSASLAIEKDLAFTNWQQVRGVLKGDEAAVEFVRFPFFDGKKWTGQNYYAALVIRPGMTVPRLVTLGEAKDLEAKSEALKDYQEWVSEPGGEASGPHPLGSKLAERLWWPVEGALKGVKRIYVSPDGILNQVALGVLPLPVEGNLKPQLLMDKYDLRIVSSTRDLLRPSQEVTANTAVLVGNPTFLLKTNEQRAAIVQVEQLAKRKSGKPQPVLVAVARAANSVGSQAPATALRASRNGACQSLPPGATLCPLLETQKEVDDVYGELKRHGWEVDEPYVRSVALEETVKGVRHPRVLHIATHGFFESAEPGRKPGVPLTVQDDPMLRSGVFLAGAERAIQGEPAELGLEDGVLTAHEASGLDLHGTELVVLSACDTGLGEDYAGEGVFGLRRGLQEAGAESVLMSLWQVPDRETRELMSLFYQKWLGGKDKPSAFREAQGEMRQRVRERYGKDAPFYWAAFVLVGH